MDIQVSYEEGRVPITIFHIKGDLTSGEQLEKQGKEAFESGTRNLLLDLTDVPFISSSGLRALHYLYMLLRGDSPDESDEAVKAGIRDGTYKSPHLKLLKPSKNVEKAISVAGYDMFLEIYQNSKKAIASF